MTFMASQTDLDLATELRLLPTFADVSREAIVELAAAASQRRVHAGVSIVDQGVASAGLVFLLRGAAKVWRVADGDGGATQVVLDVMRSPCIIADLSVFDGAPAASSVVTLRSSQVATIDRRVVMKVAMQHPTLGRALLTRMAQEVRAHTRRIDEYGGIASVMPKYLAAFLILTMASIGLPLLSGFVGEFLILLGSFGAYATWDGLPTFFAHPKLLVAISTTGVILAAVYMLFLFQKVMFGPNDNPKNKNLLDLTPREVGYLVPMVLMAFWLGCYPNTFLSDIDPAVAQTMAQFKTKWAQSVGETATPKRMSAEAPVDPDVADRNAKTIDAAPGVMAPAPTQVE